jgi:hypothetical protein
MNSGSRPATVLVCGLILALAACDVAPGPRPAGEHPPRLTDFSYSPGQVIGSSGETAGPVPVSLTIAAQASDPDGDLDHVAFVVQSPLPGRPAIATGRLDAAGAGRYETTTSIQLPAAEIGVYTIIVYAVDRSGLSSNQFRGSLIYSAEGSPPVIERVDADPEVVRPPTTLRLIATVSDPDGLANISRVVGTAPNGSQFQMYDDGRSSGDDVAGDGRYTASFNVPSATPGIQTFRFQAFDRAGLSSEIVEKQITVE